MRSILIVGLNLTRDCASVEAVAPKGVGALERLRAGEIDLDGYLDLKVNEATAHLHGLGTTELEGVRALLRDRNRARPRARRARANRDGAGACLEAVGCVT